MNMLNKKQTEENTEDYYMIKVLDTLRELLKEQGKVIVELRDILWQQKIAGVTRNKK